MLNLVLIINNLSKYKKKIVRIQSTNNNKEIYQLSCLPTNISHKYTYIIQLCLIVRCTHYNIIFLFEYKSFYFKTLFSF